MSKDADKAAVEEAYRRFPDEVEPIPEHPAGKITVDRGSLRYAFLEGALYAAMQEKNNG
jgi:hypothetical protein